jgi:hypothetical protein
MNNQIFLNLLNFLLKENLAGIFEKRYADEQEPAYFHNVSNRDKNTITVSASGAHAVFVNYFEIQIFASN